MKNMHPKTISKTITKTFQITYDAPYGDNDEEANQAWLNPVNLKLLIDRHVIKASNIVITEV